MRFIPSEPDSHTCSWESAFGLFSFHVVAILLSSVVVAVAPFGPTLRVGVSGIFTIGAAFLYAQLAERCVRGALRHPRCRRVLAWRAALLATMIALFLMVGFRLVRVTISDISRGDLYVGAFLLLGLFVVPWLEMWAGLTLAGWLKRDPARSN